MRSTRLSRRAAALVATTLAGSLLAACGSSGAKSADTAAGPVHIKVWAWYPEFQGVVDHFNATHTDVKVDWEQAGVGQDEYTKLKTALKAGSGAPDVAMLEFQELPTIEMTKHLVDMGKYGANAVKNDYVDWAWKESSSGDKVYAIPVDAGPMAMLYRTDIFQQYGLTVPTTWDEFAQQAAKLKAAAPDKYLTDFGANEEAMGWLQGLQWQAGARPYTYSADKLPNIGVNLADDAAKKVYSYWGGLVKQKLVDTTNFGTTDFYAGLSSGKYASYIAAGWGPGYLAGVAKATQGKWRAAPLPQWTKGGNDQGDWGGSSFSVTDQSKHPKEAALVARELFGTDTGAWQIGIDKAFLFPTVKPILNGDYFKNKTYDFFGGQAVNQVFVPAANSIGTFDWSPFQDYAYNTAAELTGKAASGQSDFASVPGDLQSKVADYAKQQGFTVN